MRHSRLLALILTGFLSSHCSLFDSKNSDDDDDGGDSGEGGESGESTKGGASGSAGRPSTGGTGSSGKGGSGTGGSKGGTTSVGGSTTGGSPSGGDANSGALGGSDPGSGGDGATGGTSETGGAGGTLGGSGGSGGTTGGTGGSGTGGTGGGLTCDSGEGLELLIEPGEDSQSGWIDGSSNCVGIQGAAYASVDEVGSTLTITESDGHVCVSGTATRVLEGDFTYYWGARLVIQLNNDGNATALPYNAVTHGVDGFKFTLSGTGVPDELRPTFYNSASATQYCKRICASGAQSILLSEATVDCWDGVSTATPTGTSLERLELSIPSNETADVPFDFCIDGLTAITNNATVGNPGTCPEATPVGTCYGQCGVASSTCYCDSLCLDDLTGCCPDFEEQCL